MVRPSELERERSGLRAEGEHQISGVRIADKTPIVERGLLAVTYAPLRSDVFAGTA